MDYFYYIIIGDTPAGYPLAARPFKSNLNYFEFEEYIKDNTVMLHESGNDCIFYMGTLQFVNPKIMMVDDFKNYSPYIIER